MKILIVNKFLYPKGGSETYVLQLGHYLETHGQEVQYFGMEHEGRCVGNHVQAYTRYMDFHSGSQLAKLMYPVQTIYSFQARRQIRLVLEDFQPDVVHLNNFNFQLTPSILLEIKKYERENHHKVKIVLTAHDYQLICPNHMLYNPLSHSICEKCLGKNFIECTKGRCIHGSTAKSIVGTCEAVYWNWRNTYRYIDKIICPTCFMKSKMDTNPVFFDRTVVLHNFIQPVEWKGTNKKDYILYFGRLTEEKGVRTLINVCQALPEIPFVFAGSGPLEEELRTVPNIRYVGFQESARLEKLIREARFSVCPSEWYENCPFSVMESQMYGTPVLGAAIGGIPELIEDGRTGELFESGNAAQLTKRVKKLWYDPALIDQYSRNCQYLKFDDIRQYAQKILKLYREDDRND